MGAGARPGGRRGRAALCMSWLSSPLWPPTLMAAITLECRVRSISCTASARSASVRSCSGTALSACARAPLRMSKRCERSMVQAPCRTRSSAGGALRGRPAAALPPAEMCLRTCACGPAAAAS